MKEKADTQSIEVFGKNLKPYIMQSPILDRIVLGIDPGYRTGCKVVRDAMDTKYIRKASWKKKLKKKRI